MCWTDLFAPQLYFFLMENCCTFYSTFYLILFPACTACRHVQCFLKLPCLIFIHTLVVSSRPHFFIFQLGARCITRIGSQKTLFLCFSSSFLYLCFSMSLLQIKKVWIFFCMRHAFTLTASQEWYRLSNANEIPQQHYFFSSALLLHWNLQTPQFDTRTSLPFHFASIELCIRQ